MRLDIQAVLSPQFKARLNGTISRGLQVVDINEDTGHPDTDGWPDGGFGQGGRRYRPARPQG